MIVPCRLPVFCISNQWMNPVTEIWMTISYRHLHATCLYPFLYVSSRHLEVQCLKMPHLSSYTVALVGSLLFLPGLSSQMPGVVSPHELLQKLQLVQQEQNLASNDPPRLCPGLAPRFLGPGQGADSSVGSVAGPVPNQTEATVGQKATMQFQVSNVNCVSISLLILDKGTKEMPSVL